MAKEGIFCLGIILEALVIVEMPKSNSNFEGYSVFISVLITKMFLLQKKTYKVFPLVVRSPVRFWPLVKEE